MTAYYVGNSSGNGDANAGTGVVVVPFVLEWLDQGDFGFVPPHNPRLFPHVILTGNVRLTRFGVSSNVIATPVVLTGSFRLACKITTTTTNVPFFLVGLTHLVLFLDEAIVFATFLGGELRLQTYGMLTREFFALRDGVRPSFPWSIYVKDIRHYSQIKIATTFQQPIDRPFLIAADFDPVSDPILVALGGKPNWIGMVLEQLVNNLPVQVVRFREPELYEVVYVVPTKEVLRWEETAWVAYSTMPERAVDGQLVLELFDPEGIYRYYARLLGLLLAEWQYDTAHLRTLIDPISCPDAFVSLLANNFGLDISNETPTDRKREFIRQFVLLQKEKGTDQSIRDALRVLGYTGYAAHVWVIPGGTSSDYIEKPLGYDNDPPVTYFPASQVGIHLNDLDGEPLTVIDDGVRADVADFLGRYILPAHVRVRFFSTDIPVRASNEAVAITDSFTITDV